MQRHSDDTWFDVESSYNPAIHNVKAALQHRHAHPNDASLPPPHPEVTKYLVTPKQILERSREALEALKEAAEVKRGKVN